MSRAVILTPGTHPGCFGVAWPEVLIKTGLCHSNSEARHLIKQGGIRIDGEKAPPESARGSWLLTPANDCILSKGKRQHIRIVPIGRVIIEVDSEC